MLWVAVLGAATAGAGYYRFVVQPSSRRARMAGAIKAFGAAVELRFPNHAGLTVRVQTLAASIGRRLGYGPYRLNRLRMAAGLRDIGLCAIPYRLVNHRKWDEWTLPETATYDCHTDVGGAILETVGPLAGFATTVRTHHEDFQPSGGRSRPTLDARIVKACAEFSWYVRHRGLEFAIQQVEAGADHRYDPKVVRELLALVRAEGWSEAP